FTSSGGIGGVRVGSFLRRLVLATYLRSLKVLLSSDITSDSRAMYFRNIRERARTALPFLLFDADPYLVVSDWAGSAGSSMPTRRRRVTPTHSRSPTAP